MVFLRCAQLTLVLSCLAPTTLSAADRTWASPVDGVWGLDPNWLPLLGFPTITESADHPTQNSRIEINGDHACASFIGDGSSPNDRYMVIESGRKLTSDGTVRAANSARPFNIRFQDGTATGRSHLDVRGDLRDIDISRQKGHDGDYCTVAADGAVSGTVVVLDDHAAIDFSSTTESVQDTTIKLNGTAGQVLVGGDVGGTGATEVWSIGDCHRMDVLGNVTGIAITAGPTGSSSACAVTLGGVNAASADDITLGGNATLLITAVPPFSGSGNFDSGAPLLPVITLIDQASMTVEGTTTKATWHFKNGSTFTSADDVFGGAWALTDSAVMHAAGDIFNGTYTLSIGSRMDVAGETGGGAWVIEKDATFAGADHVTGGSWIVDGGSEVTAEDNIAVALAKEFNPDLLVVKNGRVRATYLGFDSAGGQGSTHHPDWDMELLGDAEVVVDPQGSSVGEGWHEGYNGGEVGDAGSEIRYDGARNIYRLASGAKGIAIGGPIKQMSSLGELEIRIEENFANGYLEIESELVNNNRTPKIIDFDAENVALRFNGSGGASPGSLETLGPDYSTLWTTPVLFLDSPCVRRWGEVNVTATMETTLSDRIANSPYQGGADGGSGYPTDALYVVDLRVAAGSTLRTGVIGGSISDKKIYYTGILDVQGSIIKLDGSPYTPVFIAARTQYGDFDGDSDPLGDLADEDLFEDHNPSCVDTADTTCSCGGAGEPACLPYNAFVDWNCDGRVDCEDRAQFLGNWTASTLSDPLACE